MNMFGTDIDPEIAARNLCDLHVRRCTQWTSVFLNTSAYMMGHEPIMTPGRGIHPVVLWACASHDNWLWLVAHARALSREYMFRYKKSNKSYVAILWASRLKMDMLYFEHGGLTPFPPTLRPWQHLIWTDTDQAVDTFREFYGMLELLWCTKSLAYYLMCVANGNGKVPGYAQHLTMTWIKGRPRPAWMPEKIPTNIPTWRQIDEADRWGMDHEPINLKQPSKKEWDEFCSLAQFGWFTVPKGERKPFERDPPEHLVPCKWCGSYEVSHWTMPLCPDGSMLEGDTIECKNCKRYAEVLTRNRDGWEGVTEVYLSKWKRQ